MAFTNTHHDCPDCGSSDACSTNDDGSTHCFSCDKHRSGHGGETRVTEPAPRDFVSGEPAAITRRNLTEDTCRKWGYWVGKYMGEHVQIANYKTRDGKTCGQKIRFGNKTFAVKGEIVGLYGQHLWRDGGRRVVVTEGEIDALSVSQAFDNKWPVVSVPHGVKAKKYIAQAIDWLDRYDQVVFCFDGDDVGRKGAAECAALLTPGKAHIAELPLKDANDMLVANRSKELVQCLFDAREYRPDGIVNGKELWDVISHKEEHKSKPYPFIGLNSITHGMRLGELVTVTAGSGIGKSLFCREIAHHLLGLGETVGYIALEESVRRTALGILGIHMNKPLHLDDDMLDENELRPAFDRTVGNGKFYTYDHFGSMESDNLLSKIRYLIKGFDCKWIFLDHLSIVVSGIQGDDERRLIDNTMTKLRSLVEETGCGMVLVSHLKRVDTGHEEGGRVSLHHLRGSQAIAQLSDMVIGLERNQQSDRLSNETKVRVLKNRFSGETGHCSTLYYNIDTGRCTEEERASTFEETNNNNEPF
jgi:twinkle protein